MTICTVAVPFPKMAAQYQTLFKTHRVIYLCGRAGYGKTTTTLSTFRQNGRKVLYLSASQPDAADRITQAKETLVILDDEQTLTDATRQQQLLAAITAAPEKKRFLVLSRRSPLGFWKNLELEDQLVLRGYDDLAFGLEELCDLMCRMDLPTGDAPRILEVTHAKAMSIRFLLLRMQRGEALSDQLIERVNDDLTQWCDLAVFQRATAEIRHALICLAPFDTFRPELVQALTGDRDVEQLFQKMRENGNYLALWPDGSCSIEPIVYRNFLRGKQRQIWSHEQRRINDQKAGRFFRARGDLTQAIMCYDRADDQEQVAQLLIENADRNPGCDHFYATEKYYRKLPKQTVLASPELMSAMSMLCSISFKPEESEHWFEELEFYLHSDDRTREERRRGQERLWYLRIGLPHRGTADLVTMLRQAYGLLSDRKMSLQPFSVTGNMPSIANGGKDFASWLPRCRFLYQMLSGILRLVLGQDGIGLPELALGEALLITQGTSAAAEIISLLHKAMCYAEANGSVTVRFAISAVLSRLYLLQGQPSEAKKAVLDFQRHNREQLSHYLSVNLAALLIRIDLHMGGSAATENWLLKHAPDEKGPLLITDRYALLTKARCYLAVGKLQSALGVLSMQREYSLQYHRPQGVLESDILLAVTLHRMNNEDWKERWQEALSLSAKYGIREALSAEGTAVLPLWKECPPAQETDETRRLYVDISHQASLYPRYLLPAAPMREQLRPLEITLLGLLSRGAKNEEIAQEVHLSVNTVKTYLRTLYAKLGVHNRTEACRAAEQFLSSR